MEHCVAEPCLFGKKSSSGKNEQKWSKLTQKLGFWTFFSRILLLELAETGLK